AGTQRRGATVVIEMATLLREEGEELSVCQARPIEEELHLMEKCDRILLQHKQRGPLAKHDKPLVWAARQFAENRLRALRRGEPIPLRDDHQRRDLNLRRIIIRLACLPVTPVVLKYAGWAAQYRRGLFGADGIGGYGGRRPRLELRYQVALSIIGCA